MDIEPRYTTDLNYEITAKKVTSTGISFSTITLQATIVLKLVDSYMVYEVKQIPFLSTFTEVHEIVPNGLGNGNGQKVVSVLFQPKKSLSVLRPTKCEILISTYLIRQKTLDDGRLSLAI